MTRSDLIHELGRRKAGASRELDCVTAFRKIARDCVAPLRAHHASACAGDAEAVHKIRVAITRLRATVSFFAGVADDEEWRRLKQEIAWLNLSLGAVRDTDVMIAYARRKRYRAWAEQWIGASLDADQIRDHRQLVRALRTRRFHALVDGLSDWIEIERRESTRPLRAYCKRELERWCGRLVRKGRRLDRMDSPQRHRLRIRAKHYRYMLEAMTYLVPLLGRGEYRQRRRMAKRLQDTLGDLRDLKRFASLAEDGDKPPPGYRRRRRKLLQAAAEARRMLKRAASVQRRS